jgi:hypothetical protein
MGAAAQTDPVLSLLFFYTYRLTMTLAVFPLLFAFIIQAFITKRDLESQSKKATASASSGGKAGAGAPTNEDSSQFSGKGVSSSDIIACILIPVFVDGTGRGFKYRRQLYGELLEMESSFGSKTVPDQLETASRYREYSKSDASQGTTEHYFSAHRFESHERDGHVSGLNPRDGSVIFTDIASPLTTAISRQRRRRPSSLRATHGGTPDKGYKVEKEVDKGTSMMAFWAQGEKTTSDAQKDKDKAALLQRRLDESTEQLAAERRRAQEREARYQELLRKYEEQKKKAQSSTSATEDGL